MSMRAQASYQLPETTARVARTIFPEGNLVMRMDDELMMLFCDQEFADLYPTVGQPAAPPFRLAFVSLLQFMQGLTDRQAAAPSGTRCAPASIGRIRNSKIRGQQGVRALFVL